MYRDKEKTSKSPFGAKIASVISGRNSLSSIQSYGNSLNVLTKIEELLVVGIDRFFRGKSSCGYKLASYYFWKF